MFDKLCRFVQFFLMLAPFGIAEISVDYYFGDGLRMAEILDCNNEMLKYSCQYKCGSQHACLMGKCFCLQKEEEPLDEGSSEEIIEKSAEQDNSFIDFQDYTEMTPLLYPQLPATLYEPKPALRHHIAHFCPNLDLARECIRKCRKVGRPAFCGKDHVCYCGHMDDHPIGNEIQKLNPADEYAQFKDLYAKYFGPTGPSLNETDSLESNETVERIG